MTKYERMRDALAAARVCISSFRRTVRDHERAKGVLEQIDAALALPVRNCDNKEDKEKAK